MKKFLVATIGSLVSLSILATSGKVYAEDMAGSRDSAEDVERKCLRTIDIAEYKDGSYRQKLNKCLEEAVRIDENQGNYKRAYKILQTLGHDNVSIDDAEKYFLRALEDVKKVKNKDLEDKESEAIIYGILGNIYKVKGDKKKAKEYYMEAYNQFEAIEKNMGKNTEEPIGPAEFMKAIKSMMKQLDESK